MIQFSRENPGLEPVLRRRLQLLRSSGFPVGPATVEEPPFPERLGDFRLLRRLGSGGMGVVYLARQESLGREVALKLIRPEQLFFPHARERFRREVEAVARLQHPGIVPVYTVGEEEGVPFFAMERIAGCTLAEGLNELSGRAPESLRGSDLAAVIARHDRQDGEAPPDGVGQLPESWLETCLRLVLQVAEAMAHAHEQGVLHRDLKPSNIALGPDGRARVLDFGVTSNNEADRMTRTGSQIGTLQYMSPEQLRGRRVDARSDVYSLGVTLYELLTLQLPYQAEDRIQVQELILRGQPDPLRARNRRVPVDAEIVCLQAMDADPSRRYRSMQAFAEDLRSLLERRPIAARPPGPLLRARRWTQRHPEATIALLLGFLLVGGTPSALLWQSRVHAEELGDSLASETRAKKLAEDRQRVAERRSVEYGELVDFLLSIFESSDPFRRHGGVLTARELLDRGVRRARTDLDEHPLTRSAFLWVMGKAFYNLSLPYEAVPLLQESLDLFRAHGGEDVDGELNRMRLLAYASASAGDLEEAEEIQRRSLARAEELFPPTSWRIASYRARLGHVLTVRGKLPEAEEQLRLALSMVRNRPRLQPHRTAEITHLLGQLLARQADVAPAEERASLCRDAETYVREAIELLQFRPESNKAAIAGASKTLGQILLQQGKLEEAESVLGEALRLTSRHFGRRSIAATEIEVNVAGLWEARGRRLEAIDLMRRCVSALQELAPEGHRNRVAAESTLADMLFRAGSHGEALREHTRLLPLLRKLHPEGHRKIATTLLQQGVGLALSGSHQDAQAALEESLVAWEHLLEPDHPFVARTCLGFVDLHLATGDLDHAERYLAQAEALLEGSELLRSELVRCRLRRGRIAAARGDHLEAEAYFAAAARALEAAPPGSPERFIAHVLRASALLELGRLEEAGQLLEEAREPLERLQVPGSPWRSLWEETRKHLRLRSAGGD